MQQCVQWEGKNPPKLYCVYTLHSVQGLLYILFIGEIFTGTREDILEYTATPISLISDILCIGEIFCGQSVIDLLSHVRSHIDFLVKNN